MENNVLLVIVDCLRYDRVTPRYMPLLYEWGKNHTRFTNYWVTSHCTDPSVTHLLSGRHPDDLQLYSMMYDDESFTIPDTVEMLPQFAKRHGYTTAFFTNLRRWYKRGVDHFVDTRGWHGKDIVYEAAEMVKSLPKPWLIIVHTDAMHTEYLGGSYDSAAQLTDRHLAYLLAVVDEWDTTVVVTADHGEGLGQRSVSGRCVLQHGSCLDEFITHVPLLVCFPEPWLCKGNEIGLLFDNGSVYDYLSNVLSDDKRRWMWPYLTERENVFQVGANPDAFHRGVVFQSGEQYILEATQEDDWRQVAYYITHGASSEGLEKAPKCLAKHLSEHGIGLDEFDAEIVERLRGLGYWE